jgi:peptidoglycan LD-endopeptidase CwlK
LSAQLLRDDVKFFQRLLRMDGLYLARLDGKWGPRTEAAAVEFEKQTDSIRDSTRTFDVRSEGCIRTLSLRVQREARLCLGRLLDAGFDARVISGTRTYTEQDMLYRQGRSGSKGRIVTNARGGQSNHNFGIAWDIGLFDGTGKYITAAKPYKEAGGAGRGALLEWGGDWKKFPDPPHYQFRMPLTLADMRMKFEAGKADQAFTDTTVAFA